MKIKEIKELILMAKKEGVTKLRLEEKAFKLSFSFVEERKIVNSGPIMGPEFYTSKAETGLNSHQNSTSVSIQPSEFSTSNLRPIKSPFVGTYFASPSPSAAAYVKIGDKIVKGQALCIIEAMKIMNEIESEFSGEIMKICVENEGLVEFDQVLFWVKPN